MVIGKRTVVNRLPYRAVRVFPGSDAVVVQGINGNAFRFGAAVGICDRCADK